MRVRKQRVYNEEDFLAMSGLQHFSFCRRQWALIHIEQQWEENIHTIAGEIFHERVHDEEVREKRGDVISVRGLRVFSPDLGISGCCDCVEFRKDENGIPLAGEEGLWQPYPVEYKKGKMKANDADRLQLCAQAMCLEYMLCCDVKSGAVFYGETHRRENVRLDDDMRSTVRSMLKEMHEYQRRAYTPKVKTGKHCRSCSLESKCLPVLCKSIDAKKYIHDAVKECL